MKNARRIIPVIIFCLIGLGLLPDAKADTLLSRILPVSGLLPGWALEGPIKKYTGEDLFEYINGEAELYVQFGFKILTAGLYLKDGNDKLGIAADVYEMGSALEAFGIYANYRKPEAEPGKAEPKGLSVRRKGCFTRADTLFSSTLPVPPRKTRRFF